MLRLSVNTESGRQDENLRPSAPEEQDEEVGYNKESYLDMNFYQLSVEKSGLRKLNLNENGGE